MATKPFFRRRKTDPFEAMPDAQGDQGPPEFFRSIYPEHHCVFWR